MKKQLLLSVLSLFALVACGGKTSETSQSSSSESSSSAGETSSSESSSSSNSSVETKDWTKEQKEMMQDHLYGEVLPYIDLGEGATIQYVDWVAEFQILGSKSAPVTADTLKAYAALYTTEDGWKNITDQYKVPDNAYIFEKEITEVEDSVQVQFFARDTQTNQISTNGNGSFVLAAMGNPLFSDFPSDVLDAETKYRGSDVTIPVYPAQAYLVPDPDYVDFYCLKPVTDTDPEATYTKILQDAKFTVTKQTDYYGDTNNVATSPDKKYAVGYSYVADYQALEIYLTGVPHSELATDTWPKDGLDAAFKAYEQKAFEVPQMTSTSETSTLKYYGYEDDYNELFVEYGMTDYVSYDIDVFNATEDDYNAYVGTTLKEAGWTEAVLEGQAVVEETTVTKELTKEFEGKTATIDVVYDSESSLVTIVVYLYMQDTPEAEPTGWPTEGLNTAFSTYEQTPFEVPEMTSETSTLTYSGEESSMNSIYKNQGATAKIKYVITVTGSSTEDFNKYVETTLPTTGWTLDQAKTEEIADGTKVFTKTTDGHTARLDVSPGVGQTTIFVYLYPQEAAQSN